MLSNNTSESKQKQIWIQLLEQNINHFKQADGTPLTKHPLLDIIGEEALQILEGNIPPETPKYATMLFKHMKRVRPTLNISMTFQHMCQGFQKWREQTTTSPSNKHLGIYKSLINAMKYNIRTPSEEANNTEYNSINNQPLTIAEATLQIQYQLMTLAICECHTYKWWLIVHNFLIEKLPGIPIINKLRVINIYEADWSLIQRYYVAYTLSKTASEQNTVTTEQAGARPGRSSIELATNRVLTYEIIRYQRLAGAVMYNDAKACYDRIIENGSNLTFLDQELECYFT
jgi:hypothetical protein